MNRVKKPIQYKMIRAILLTSSAVLLLTIIIFMGYEFYTFKGNAVDRMSVLSAILSDAIADALIANNHAEADHILNSLRGQEHIVSAALYDSGGILFSKYPDLPADELILDPVRTDGFFFTESYLHGFQPVVLGRNRVGTLYLRYDMQVLNRQLNFFILVAVIMFVVSFLLAWFISYRAQKGISRPIVALADVAKIVSNKNDYTVRAIKQSEDEIGLLTDAFNKMLMQIEKQNLALRENEKRFRTLADNIAQLAWISDETGRITWFNKRWYEYTGSTFEEMQGWGWQKVQHPDHLEHITAEFKKALSEGGAFEETFPLRGADGKYRWFLTRAVPIYDEKGSIQHWFGTNTDITERLEAEEALRLSEEFSRTLLESSPDFVAALDLQGHFLSINPQGLKMFEIDDPFEVVNMMWEELWGEEKSMDATAALNKARKGSISHFQEMAPTAKGTVKWWDVLLAPVYGGGGKVERLIAVARDISKIKALEQQKDDFLGIASHELKTPVTSIKAYAQVLQSGFEEKNDPISAQMLKKMDLQLDRLTKLITNLLDVTQIDQGKLQYHQEIFDFHVLVKEVIEEIQRTSTKHNIVVKGCEELQVYGDRDRLGQVMTNLLTNAIKYSPKADRVEVKSHRINGMVTVSVHDFGIGLSAQDLRRVFDRFYRVAEPGLETYPGLGLGLYISSGIIERHGGKIWAESEKGEGSTFCFSLPLVDSDLI